MRTVVIGSGAGGLTTASTIRRYNKDMEIVVITKEKYVAYSPCAIPYVIAGEIPSFQDIVMHTPEDYRKNKNIEIITESTVVDIDSENKNVIYYDKDRNKNTLKYDYLVIATGGETFIPPIEGKDLEGVFKVKTIEDGMKIKDYAEKSKSATVIGAGAIGLEMAYALKKLGLKVTVVEMAPQVLPRALDIDMAKIVLKYLKDLGIEVILEKPVSKILGDENNRVKGVVVGEKSYSCDMVVMATGTRPNLELGRKAGCEIGRLAIKVNSKMETSVPNIYAVGDCVETVDFITKQVTLSPFGSTAVRQGKVAGRNIAGIPSEFKPVLNAMVSKIGDLEIGGTGISELRAHQNRLEVVVGKAKALTRARYYPGGKPIYVKLIFDMNKTLIGCQIVGGERVSERIDAMSLGILKGVTCEELVNMEFSYAPPVSMVVDPIVLAAEDAWEKFRKLE
ncbi:pyridine nucleotide-disulfide oxidoreductase [Methanofervidicoccus sp. A16]|uniref:NAD(P)/FAD-dependent oxidoreductase n=1 Tax=Methanofervidicoccus sp. A16 TaxID=2607662 RepID=UPI001189FEA6|nr:FAD-dependent oxidoreductase [Methanofervidicoccus sp. A16]AXI25132.1 pyridine nucleotide-disulfide oxidoreductase [Methanofervidicoccus sp. A16]